MTDHRPDREPRMARRSTDRLPDHAIQELARDVDFAVDLTEPRAVLLARFEMAIRVWLIKHFHAQPAAHTVVKVDGERNCRACIRMHHLRYHHNQKARLRQAEATVKQLRQEIAACQREREALTALVDDWSRAAEHARLHRGQETRTLAGHEVLANCAAALRAALETLRTDK